STLAFHSFRCDADNAHATGDGFDLITETGSTCGAGSHLDQNRVHVDSAGNLTIVETVTIKEGDASCTVGRRPAGLVQLSPAEESSVLGAYFAETAYLEAASIVAFERLGAELRAHGAPEALI